MKAELTPGPWRHVCQYPKQFAAASALVGLLVIVIIMVATPPLFAAALLQLGLDHATDTPSQHRTQVEPDSFAYGDTIVTVFQSGLYANGGASSIDWATSSDGGATWKRGNLPGLTKDQNPMNPYDRVSDPSVTYSARQGLWLAASVVFDWTPEGGLRGVAVLVNRSPDGMNWEQPVTAAESGNLDKPWVVCDSTATSPYYGLCHIQFTDLGERSRIYMVSSNDGGLTWASPRTTAGAASGKGGQPVVQPDGTVIVPILSPDMRSLLAFHSTDGGRTWSGTLRVASVTQHVVAGGLRVLPLPSAEVDASGKVYVVWQDCRFQAECQANDIVMSTSGDGISWATPTRIPTVPVGSGVDHFIPGLGVTTNSGKTFLALAYYYYSDADCSEATCRLNVGFVSSSDGGQSWTPSTRLAGAMNLSWLPYTRIGPMVADYISTSFVGATAYPVFAAARPPRLGLFDAAIFTVRGGIALD